MDNDLDAILAREKAATEGPWHIFRYGDEESPSLVIHSDNDNRVCFMATPGSHGDPAKIDADAGFIAHAREDVPALVARVRELEAGLDHIEEALENADDDEAYQTTRRLLGKDE